MKNVYDEAGVNEVGKIFKSMAYQSKDGTRKEKEWVGDAIDFLLDVLYKMDTCTSDCFENIQKQSVASCDCNDEHLSILLDDSFKIADA